MSSGATVTTNGVGKANGDGIDNQQQQQQQHNGNVHVSKHKKQQSTVSNDVIVQSSLSEEQSYTTTSNGNHQEEIVHKTISSSSSTLKSDSNGNQGDDAMQILGQLKNIERINEKRRLFLHNTINESSVEENGKETVLEKRSYTREIEEQQQNGETIKSIDKETSSGATEYGVGHVQLRSPPSSPPPKPPLANRHSLTSPPPTPVLTNKVLVTEKEFAGPLKVERPPSTPVTITSAVIPEPTKITTVTLQEDNKPQLRHHVTLSKPAANGDDAEEVPKQISTNHYDRLIEELKCPGCAAPMRGPILLCESGHSVCEQCTRILMLCPLCKEPFTKLRSRTVEALCSKAHFRCTHSANGCSVRLQLDLLDWHQKQCIYKPMKCFMGRVWGDCQWTGREIDWKDHLEKEHGNKVFRTDCTDLIWNMGIKQKPLTGYYVFQMFDEMFNFYEIYDKDRVLFTMACTSTVRERKSNFAFEVTMIHQDNDALAITQKFPVHSEYDKDILGEGTCVSISLGDLSKFIDEERLLHYRVKILQIKPPRKVKIAARHSTPVNGAHSKDFQNTQIEGVNLKNVPAEVIVTRKPTDDANGDNISMPSNSGSAVPTASSDDEVLKVARKYNKKIADDSGSESDPEIEAFVNKRWGTPQLHFNRKFLKPPSSTTSTDDSQNAYRKRDTLGKMDRKYAVPDDVSIASTSYKKRMTNTLRKSFRSIKSDFIEMKPFGKKNAGKKSGENGVTNGKST